MNKPYIVFVFIAFALVNCGEPFIDEMSYIRVNNASDKTIVVVAGYSYPDTSLIISMPDEKGIGRPGGFGELLSKTPWKETINGLPSDTLMIFVFDKQIWDNTPWDSIRTNYLTLKRYDLSIDDLQRMNWTITYP